MKKILVFILTLLFLIFLFSLYNYIWDLVFYFDTAITHANYLGGYFLYYLTVRVLIFLPLIIIYWYIFRNIPGLYIIKIASVLIVCSLLPYIVIKDDWVLSSIKTKDIQRFVCYNLSGFTLVLIYEFYLRKRAGLTRIKKVTEEVDNSQ